MPRQIVLVSGAPGTGKTTLAVPLAGELGFPLLSKDDIKVTLWDALDLPAADLLWSRKVGGAAMEVLCPLAPSRQHAACVGRGNRAGTAGTLGVPSGPAWVSGPYKMVVTNRTDTAGTERPHEVRLSQATPAGRHPTPKDYAIFLVRNGPIPRDRLAAVVHSALPNIWGQVTYLMPSLTR